MDSPIFKLCVILIVGVMIIIMGILNMRGNISALHKYHTKHITELNKPTFGKLTGIGHIIVGLSLIINAILSSIATIKDNPTYALISNIILITGVVVGIGIIFYAIIKYNKKNKTQV